MDTLKQLFPLKTDRIFLSPPYQTGDELEAIKNVLDSNWLAPVGPDLALFENKICELTGFKYAVTLSSGTAALHLGLKVIGVKAGTEVLSSNLTFAGAINPIKYENAKPVFIDACSVDWNMDVSLLEKYLNASVASVSAIVPTHIYGMPADVSTIQTLADKYNIPVLHDLAECLGGKIDGLKMGAIADRGILSFNGNKLITTSGGGAYVTNSKAEAEHVLYLSTQAKSAGNGYVHKDVGFNYRLSNVLAALGLVQLNSFEQRIRKKREIYSKYKVELEQVGLTFQQEKSGVFSDRWLSCATLSQELVQRISTDHLIQKLEEVNVECRSVWKPMDTQPVFKNEKSMQGNVALDLHQRGICLPSGCGLTASQQEFVIEKIKLILK